MSAHCPHWFSLRESTGPLGQDALAHMWPEGLLYAPPPPPFPLILPTTLPGFSTGPQAFAGGPIIFRQDLVPPVAGCHGASPTRGTSYRSQGVGSGIPIPAVFNCGSGRWRAVRLQSGRRTFLNARVPSTRL